MSVFLLVMAIWLFISYVALEPRRRFLMPPPQDVLLVGLLNPANASPILLGLWSTTQVALVGLALSIAIGSLVAIAMIQARWIEWSIYPWAVVLQTIPILAIVPLIGFWFQFGFNSRVLVCVLIALFPIITNTLFGLKSTDQMHHDLFTLQRASRWQRLLKLQLPGALPAIVSGWRIAAGLSVIGAIVGDFFFRQGEPGIGRLIVDYRARCSRNSYLPRLPCRPCSDCSCSGASASSGKCWWAPGTSRTARPNDPGSIELRECVDAFVSMADCGCLVAHGGRGRRRLCPQP
ncbi:MAG: ABC transporter permease, partial [Chloroflexota bacterium]|nr:ABC transporter permease [Chloroflexota bacterium]